MSTQWNRLGRCFIAPARSAGRADAILETCAGDPRSEPRSRALDAARLPGSRPVDVAIAMKRCSSAGDSNHHRSARRSVRGLDRATGARVALRIMRTKGAGARAATAHEQTSSPRQIAGSSCASIGQPGVTRSRSSR